MMMEMVGSDLCAHTDKLRWLWIIFTASALLGFLPYSGSSGKLRSLVLRWTSRGKLWAPQSDDSPGESGSRTSSLRTSKLQAIILNSNVPQKWFWHFYFVGTLWNSVLLVTHMWNGFRSPCLANDSLPRGSTTLLPVLVQIQVMRRLYETLKVMQYREGARMHVIVYIFGLSYYVAVSLSFFLHTPASHATWQPLPGGTSWACQLAGAVIFFWGSWHQWRCHAILASLRTKASGSGKKSSAAYAIPHGDWFDHVSCAHYLAEIVLYFGLVVASGGSNVTIWLLFAFVVANLSVSGLPTHKWYRAKFKEYPKSRRAIFPFLC